MESLLHSELAEFPRRRRLQNTVHKRVQREEEETDKEENIEKKKRTFLPPLPWKIIIFARAQ